LTTDIPRSRVRTGFDPPQKEKLSFSIASVSIPTMQNRGTNPSSRYLLFLSATTALGGLLFGFDLAIIVGAGPFLIERFGLGDLSLGWAFSSLLFGCALGSAVAGRLTERYGRRRMLLWVAALFAVTSVVTGTAPSFTVFLLGRFLGGVAVGGVSVLSPMYVAEVSPPASRGRMGAMYQLSITAGILISYFINYWLRNLGPWNWRWMFISGALPSLVFLAFLRGSPETPRFLFKIGRNAEAHALLLRLMNQEEAAASAAEIQASLAQPGSSLQETVPARALFIGFVLAILVHVSGINTIIDYAPIIFKSAGWKIDAALFSTFVIGGVNFLFTFISFWTIDRYGRKPLYIIGSLGMSLALLTLVAAVAMERFEGGLVLGAIALYIACFASCIGPVFWTLVPEIFPNRVRGKAMVVPVLTQWMTNAAVVLFFPLALNRAGKLYTFAFLALMALLQALFTWRFVPETKGKTLEQIEEHWKRRTSKFDTVLAPSE
jgi:SP family arabinose:H+ symporter-like MFS transporter